MTSYLPADEQYGSHEHCEHCARRVDAVRKWVAWVLIFVAGLMLVFVIASVDSAYRGRQALVRAERVSCERDKADRALNAAGWRAAEAARWTSALDQTLARATRQASYTDALRYQAIARAEEQRARVDCKRVYPSAELFPWQGEDPIHPPPLGPQPAPPYVPHQLTRPPGL